MVVVVHVADRGYRFRLLHPCRDTLEALGIIERQCDDLAEALVAASFDVTQYREWNM